MATSPSAQSSPPSGIRPTVPRRIRAALACQRCKGRKQKCEGGLPTCRSCSKVGIACVYEPTLRPRYPGGKMLYINALEERIAFLEAQLPEQKRDHFGGTEDAVSPTQLPRNIAAPCSDGKDEHRIEEENSTVVDGVAYLSLCASGTTDAIPEPFYMGSSSGATIARLIQSAIFSGKKASNTAAERETLRSDSVSSLGSSLPPPSLSNSFHPYPQPAQARRLFLVFFNRMHTKWPILDRKVYENVYEHQYDQGSLPIIEMSTLHLIYAISARFLQLTKQQGVDVDYEAHFMAAIKHMDYIMERHNTSTVQFLTMLAIYGQRSPYGAGVWSQLPSSDTAFSDLTSTHTHVEHSADRSNILPFIHDIKLRKLQSKIQRTVFRVDIDHNTLCSEDKAHEEAKVEAIRQNLDSWVHDSPKAVHAPQGEPQWMYQPESTHDQDSCNYFTLQYHKAILSLYTNVLPNLSVDDRRFITCAQSAARISTAAEPSRPTDPLLGAVKDVFMEVAEDIPASQGWRLFTELVQSDIQMPDLTSTNMPDGGNNVNSESSMAPSWDGNSEFSFRNFNSVTLSESTPLGAQSGWEHGFFAGYD
ncbi:hypothetical protein GRF29_161g1098201 [Pseudopithomyces chartarum]|uniref:Zn(2)-C6 fungal-type domain-containing protein n=1 Tax=Pseudopithomyces chartarum TaxID=1892770 RepID=A0AAN6LUD6_9PLEO|nr:hypothetical protein GRF29_161g1098201 [Pseudopithomyces chartarum]